jgi:oligopeptide/dipeptide ABC transporter ATP-binding protein
VGHVKAVDGVSLALKEREVLGLVGESGCGKTTVGRTILRLYDPTAGEIRYRNAKGDWVDIARISQHDMKPLRREMRMIFQDPFSSLNPRLTVKDIIGEPLEIHGVAHGKEAEQRVAELMEAVGLNPALMRRYPHEFSGGQRQRIGLARTLSLNPRLIIADEPVSALDVSVQAQVLNLLQELQARLGLTLIFIAHDLSVVEHISDRIAVMYVGKIVELTETDELLHHPLHPYTEALLSAIPPADPDIHPERIRLQGEVPSPANPPKGCVFHPRCAYARDMCSQQAPNLTEISGGHFVSCHFAKELSLRGIGGLS